MSNKGKDCIEIVEAEDIHYLQTHAKRRTFSNETLPSGLIVPKAPEDKVYKLVAKLYLELVEVGGE